MRQHGHRRFSLRLLTVFARYGHIGLAGMKLSMILDNLVAKRHDCFVTTG
jgi:hypothetical protein